jgi:hypothetical protein
MVTTAFALSGCVGDDPTAATGGHLGSARFSGEPNVDYTFFGSAAPASILSSPPAVEYGIRFHTSLPGRVMGLRFYRPAGDSENVTVLLLTEAGTKTDSVVLLGQGASPGWQWDSLPQPRRISSGANYRVSAKVTQAVGETYGYFNGGAVVHDVLTADLGFYRLSGNATMYSTTYAYFVDVIFRPDPE